MMLSRCQLTLSEVFGILCCCWVALRVKFRTKTDVNERDCVSVMGYGVTRERRLVFGVMMGSTCGCLFAIRPCVKFYALCV